MLPFGPAITRNGLPSTSRRRGAAHFGLATFGPLRFSKNSTYPAVLPLRMSVSPSPSQSTPTGVASAPHLSVSASCRKYTGAANPGVRSADSLPVFSTSATRPSSSPTIRSMSPSRSQSNATGTIICRSIASRLPAASVSRLPAAYFGSVRVPVFSK